MMLLAVGALHGINPIMGWLLAVARGFHEGQRSAVYRSLVPIGLGHATAVGAGIAAVEITGRAMDSPALELGASLLLLVLGGIRLWRGMSVRGAGARASASDLAMWSFLAATAYGGEVQPVLSACLTAPIFPPAELVPIAGAVACRLGVILVHCLGMVAAAGAVATLAFDWLGLASLRPRRLNLDRLWAFTLVAIGSLALFIGLVTD
jgi:hypothetical protein